LNGEVKKKELEVKKISEESAKMKSTFEKEYKKMQKH